ncbi:hypothetical protein EJ04DRAFT_404431, partial [Polyplosphaeria fusca]
MSDPIHPPPNPREAADERAPPSPVAAAEKPEGQKNVASPPLDVKTLTDHALHFLATASNETLGACLVGLSAATYLVLGRFGLLLIGAAGGVVLHATWEGHTRGTDSTNAPGQDARKRERGIDVVNRVLSWRDEATRDKTKTQDDTDVKLYSGKELDFSDFRPDTAAALTELTDAVIRDYVKWWYSPILPTDDSFPATCRQTLTAFLISISSHLSRKRPADNFLDFVTRSSSMMIVFLQELAAATAASPNSSSAEAIEAYLQAKPDSRLSNIVDTEYQKRQLDVAAEDILQNYLEPKTYNCKPAQTFLRQMLSSVVLEMIIVACSKPEWINGWLVYLLEDGEPEIMTAIDAGVEGGSGQLQNLKKSVEKEECAIEEGEAEKQRKHKRVVSKAQEAMDDAMQEAARLSAMIAEEDAKTLKEMQEPEPQSTSTSSLIDDQSESTTQGIVTPTSSQSDALPEHDATEQPMANASQAPMQASPPPDAQTPEDAPNQEFQRSFTSFDQLVSNQPPTALLANPPPPLTIHDAKIVIFDDAMPGEKAVLKNKPNVEYLIQIEPASHHHSGWMTARKYSDFETLHEVLRRIAAITGATGFTEAHSTLPQWKGHTKASLVGELQRYLNGACSYKPLAESEGMKRFLDKETGISKSPGGAKGLGLGWPGQAFENMGKGMVDVLTKAPKEVAGGGKALFGGVAGVLGNVTTPLGGLKKNRESATGSPASVTRSTTAPAQAIQNRHGRAESTVSELPSHIRTESAAFTNLRGASTDSLRSPNSPIVDQQPGREAPMERRPSYNPDGDGKRSGRSSVYGGSRSASRAPSVRESIDISPAMGGDQILNLPPMPSDIPDDYTSPISRNSLDPLHSRHPSRASTTSLPLPSDSAPPLPRRPSATSLASKQPPTNSSQPNKPTPQHTPLTDQETTVLIDLFFALTTELYTLSSAWSIRLTLLNAAKTFLLRPANPQRTSIQTLIQTSFLDANTSDAGIAYHLRKIRANGLPTEEELKAWPEEMGAEEKERLRVRARRVVVEKGVPA